MQPVSIMRMRARAVFLALRGVGHYQYTRIYGIFSSSHFLGSKPEIKATRQSSTRPSKTNLASRPRTCKTLFQATKRERIASFFLQAFAGLLVCWFVGLLVCWFVGLLVVGCWLRVAGCGLRVVGLLGCQFSCSPMQAVCEWFLSRCGLACWWVACVPTNGVAAGGRVVAPALKPHAYSFAGGG